MDRMDEVTRHVMLQDCDVVMMINKMYLMISTPLHQRPVMMEEIIQHDVQQVIIRHVLIVVMIANQNL